MGNSNIVQVIRAEYIFELEEAGEYYLQASIHPGNGAVGIVKLTRSAANPEDVFVFQWSFPKWEGEYPVTTFKSKVGDRHKIEHGKEVGGFRFTPNI
jgi:hypothetical protein